MDTPQKKYEMPRKQFASWSKKELQEYIGNLLDSEVVLGDQLDAAKQQARELLVEAVQIKQENERLREMVRVMYEDEERRFEQLVSARTRVSALELIGGDIDSAIEAAREMLGSYGFKLDTKPDA